ncbi:hypothetical protein NC652_024940 [Populus alba x Populus x berolinensis]|nr:hypothetical protein NC652_024940 [Populus alba x Populus x berolinensis]
MQEEERACRSSKVPVHLHSRRPLTAASCSFPWCKSSLLLLIFNIMNVLPACCEKILVREFLLVFVIVCVFSLLLDSSGHFCVCVFLVFTIV